jgi:hypothetical protein
MILSKFVLIVWAGDTSVEMERFLGLGFLVIRVVVQDANFQLTSVKLCMGSP